MASKKEIDAFLEETKLLSKQPIRKNMDKSSSGMMFALQYITAHGNTAFPSDLAKAMGISTARVAMLANKMEAKGILVRKDYRFDSRKTVLSLTEKGILMSETFKKQFYEFIGHILDEVGKEDIRKFLDISKRMSAAAEEFELLHPRPEIEDE